MAVVPHRCPHDRIIWWSGQWEPGDPLLLPACEFCADCTESSPSLLTDRLGGDGDSDSDSNFPPESPS